jgi:allantoicase
VTHNPIASFEDLVDLANERLGGAAIVCSDDFFAGMDNLVKAKEARWDEDAYTDRGKWMDGWESKRAHTENDDVEHEDFCIVRLGAPGVIRGVVVDTAFFRGNFPSHCIVEATSVDGYPSPQQIAARTDWTTLVEKAPLQGNAKNPFTIASHHRFTHIRLRIFPDGGVARLRIYGEPLPDWRLFGGLDGDLELSSTEVGGVVVACSDMFFGSRHNLLFPAPSTGMHDG